MSFLEEKRESCERGEEETEAKGNKGRKKRGKRGEVEGAVSFGLRGEVSPRERKESKGEQRKFVFFFILVILFSFLKIRNMGFVQFCFSVIDDPRL